MSTKRLGMALASALATIFLSSSAMALTITLNHSFGSVPVSGEIVIDITAAADGSYVDITMDLSDLSAPEFVKELYLNVTDPSAISGYDAAFTDGTVTAFEVSPAGFKAGGDGHHDILIAWHPRRSARLLAGVSYDIRILGTGLTEDMFDDYGTASSKGQHRAVAKVQGTGGGDGSDWVGDGVLVPEPGSALLYSVGLLLAGRGVRRP